MRSIDNPKTWVPYMNTKDCSQGLCSLYCPQWCYIIFPPPPPPMEFPDDDVSGPNFSPFLIAIISILASALLLVSYYTIISKYCGNMDSTRRRENHDTAEAVLEDDHNPSDHEPWQTSTTGLDEALIKSITIFRYKKCDGLIEGTDCSVCLSEFQEDESLKLLPKCSHAFHVHCIDTWLRSHSNCPLCRANIISVGASPLGLTPPVTESPPENASLPDMQPVRNENVADAQNVQEHVGRVQSDLGGLPKTTSRAFSDLGNVQGRDTIIEIRGEGYEQMRRSVSMDHLCQNQLSVADILHMNQEEDIRVEECHLSPGIAGPSKQSAEGNKISNKMRVLHCVMNRVAMKRSISSSLINIAF
ncbi:hypothetical protein DITRI_Ditri07aG0170300 [Diplodiscus trichospermus]